MENPIFRKVALERLASPEQLDELMHVTTPKGWLALVGLGSLLAAALIWSIFATVQLSVPGRGILTKSDTAEAVIYVSPENARQIRPGMAAKIAPSSVKKEEFGLLLGHVTSVGELPSTQKDMLRILGNDAYAQALAQAGDLVEVHVALTADPNTPSGYRWTSAMGPPFALQSGTLCNGTVIISEQSPISLVIPRR